MLQNLYKLALGILILTAGLQSLYAGSQLRLKNAVIDTNAGFVTNGLMSASVATATRHYVVQFKSTIKVADQEMLSALGLKILRYIPDDAYIVRVPDQFQTKDLTSKATVQAVLPYVPEFKVNNEAFGASVFNQNKSEKLHVRAFENLNYDLIEKQLSSIAGVKVEGRDGGAFIVSARVSDLSRISQIDGIEWVDQYHPIKMQNLNLDEIMNEAPAAAVPGDINELDGLESGTKISGFEAAWARGYKGKGQVVAVADTGLDTGDVANLSSEFAGLKKGIIAGLFSSTWGDFNGHGTHVAGSIVAKGSLSTNKVRGGAYESQLVMESVWSEVYGRFTIGPDPTTLFLQAYNEGARVHSNSWGSPENLGEYDDSARAADEFMWKNPEMLLVFAAGNFGLDENKDGRIDEGSVSSPGTAKNVLTVGASENLVSKGGIQKKLGEMGSLEKGYRWGTAPLSEDTFSNNSNGIAAFSSRGPTIDERLKPEIVAPGTNILSQCSQLEGAGELWGRFNQDLCYCGGTSMSTPLVSAGAVVLRDYLVNKLKVTQPSAALVKALLMHTADDLYPGQFGEVGEALGQELLSPGPNSHQGYGRMNMDAATSGGLRLISSSRGLKSQEAYTARLKAGTRKVTLVYTDAPGSTAASKALVNDLDLEITADGGASFSSKSKLNNSEQILLPEGLNNIVVKITGVNVPINSPNGGQPFALVSSN